MLIGKGRDAVLFHCLAVVLFFGSIPGSNGDPETFVAKLGACYHVETNTADCNFNSTFCTAKCISQTQEGGQTTCKEYGPKPVWWTPTKLKAANLPVCRCQTTHVGSCYTVRTDHVATCHLHKDQCPVDTVWINSGFTFSGGQHCMCHDNRGQKATQFGVCKKDIQSRCSIDQSHCEPGETWIDPQAALLDHNIQCPSFNVEVGACKAPNGAKTCVVDADSCNAGDTWLTPSQAKREGAHCFLDTEVEGTPAPSPASSNFTCGNGYRVKVTMQMDGDKKFVDSFSTDQEVLVKNALKNVASVDFHEMFISSYAADSGKAIEVVCEIDVPDAEKAGELDRNLDKTSMDFALRKEGLPGSTFAETKIGCKPPKREGLGTAAIVLLVLGVLVVVIMAVIGAAVWMR
jgi:hypothetical protein